MPRIQSKSGSGAIIQPTFWLAFAGLTILMFLLGGGGDKVLFRDIPGLQGVGELCKVCFLFLTFSGALSRRSVLGWRPGFHLPLIRSSEMAGHDREGRPIYRTSGSSKQMNFVVNFMLGWVLFIFFWAFLEFIYQVVYLVRFLVAGDRPVSAWPDSSASSGLGCLLLLLLGLLLAFQMWMNPHPNQPPVVHTPPATGTPPPTSTPLPVSTPPPTSTRPPTNTPPPANTVNVSGQWVGTLTQYNLSFPFSMNLDQNGTTVNGQARIQSPQNGNFYAVMQVQGTIKGDVLVFEETRFDENHSSQTLQWALNKGSLRATPATLTGTWQVTQFPSVGGQIYLQKQ
jgi:hypothetical protein